MPIAKRSYFAFFIHRSRAPDVHPLHARKGTEPAPLSFAQERLWFLEQLEPGSTVYNICRAYRLTGELNVAALQSSLNEILRRHEVLRSAITIRHARPLQLVQQPFELTLTVLDSESVVDGTKDDPVQKRIRESAETPFDFSAGRFLRAELLRVAADEHVLILTTHHMVSDAWSMGILSQ